jgi:hypothetical protein
MRSYRPFLLQLRAATILVVMGIPTVLRAEEPIPIQQILEEPRIYHLRQVTLQGTARDVQPLDPYKLPNDTACYGAYLFKLEDDTGVMSWPCSAFAEGRSSATRKSKTANGSK